MADKDSNAIHFWDFKSNSSRDIKRKYNEEIPMKFCFKNIPPVLSIVFPVPGFKRWRKWKEKPVVNVFIIQQLLIRQEFTRQLLKTWPVISCRFLGSASGIQSSFKRWIKLMKRNAGDTKKKNPWLLEIGIEIKINWILYGFLF